MGQQQLLLLVLSTVIVGLATVAGIQAFSEGQSQATQDALTQRALNIGNDFYAVSQQPSQLGGVSLGTSNVDNAASAAGYDDATDIPAEGAGTDADCDVSGDGSVWTVQCGSSGGDNESGSDEYVKVTVDSDGPELTYINGNDITT